MKSSIRRLAKDQIGLRNSLPPNYFFEDANDGAALPDDLSELLICLTGPEGTPYSQGLWKIRLNIPIDYPQSPPTAVFLTRIFHPNVAEESGAVCLETLKRDWDPKLTLKDILVTISCLLIQPNPDSALNQKAGALIQDDYASFARQARLMTKIHAPIPANLIDTARDARRRGEETEERSHTPQGTAQNAGRAEGQSSDVLRENQAPKHDDVVKKSQCKSRKRSWAETATCIGETQVPDSDTGRRKSSRYESDDEDAQDSICSREKTSVKTLAQSEGSCRKITQNTSKIIYRARWGSGTGVLGLKARIGIRRL